MSCGVAAVLGHCRKVVYFSSNNLFYSQQTHSTSPSLDRVLLTRVFNKGPSLSIPKDMYSHSRIDPLTCTLSDRMMPSCGISMHTSNIYLSRSLQTYFHNLRRNSLLLVPQHQHHLLRKHHLSQIVGSHRPPPSSPPTLPPSRSSTPHPRGNPPPTGTAPPDTPSATAPPASSPRIFRSSAQDPPDLVYVSPPRGSHSLST